MARGWSDAELNAAVVAYRDMQQREAKGLPINKRQIYQDLAQKYHRSNKAFEYRMQNISAVLDSQAQPWIAGLKPAKNVGAIIFRQLEKLLTASNTQIDASLAPAAYKSRVSPMRSWLIGVARNRSVIRYGELMQVFAIDRFSLRYALSSIGHQSRDAGEPVLTALVVSKAHGRCSSGLAAEFGIKDDALERARLYVYWERNRERSAGERKAGSDLEKKAARFANVETRPDQAAFREAVFIACLGRCVVTGCDVPETLDASHRRGRDWRLGHNAADDGYLFRKDLHALYDRELIEVRENGVIRVRQGAAKHYGTFDGQRIKVAAGIK